MPRTTRRGSSRPVPNWTVGETILIGDGEELRVVAIETEIDEELIERGFNGVFTVEPVSHAHRRGLP